ncbi:MAG: hypothetical protein DRP58_04690 [Spirochaetes bacterium]|nr:MAG: hypothetical protein DRP58_04690 [Spirochaetota bacterium]
MFDIIIKKIGFSYGKDEVLSINNLSINKGSTTVFLGSNGSGKTTILKLISGIYSPSKGSISPGTETLKNKSVLVHQNPYLFSGSVKYNIEFGLKIRNISKNIRKSIIQKVLLEARLLNLITRKTSSLSGGEKHRLAIARALSLNPDILVLDEPFANIDPESRDTIEKLILKREKNGITTIISTHNLTSAYRLASSIIYMDKGKIIEPETNFIKGSVIKRDDYFCFFQADNYKKVSPILIPATDGDYSTAVIPYKDIFLSGTNIKTSAQNQYIGIIRSLVKKGNQFFVTIDCGISLKAIVTDLSVREFKIKEGKSIFVNFKASAVKLY